MPANTYITIVLLLHLTELITGIPCSDAFIWKKGHAYTKLTFPSVRKCAAECVVSPVCASLNFDMETKWCFLYSNGMEPADVVSGYHEHWTKSLSLGIQDSSGIWCAMFSQVKVCGMQSGSYIRDCGEPPDVSGTVKVTNHHPQGSVTTYTCQPDFISCDKNSAKTSRCQTSGLWENVSMTCERFRWNSHNTPQTSYYCPCGLSSRIQVTISGTPTVPSSLIIDVEHYQDILLHVGFKFNNRYMAIISARMQHKWSLESHVPSSWEIGQISEISLTMDDGTYTVAFNGTNVHRMLEAKAGIKARSLYVTQSFNIRELKIRRLE